MLAISCPSCGAPTRVSLQTPDRLRCEKCGWTGAPPEKARQQISTAVGVLTEGDAQERQLHGFARSIVSGRAVIVYLVLLASMMGWAMQMVRWMQPEALAQLSPFLLPSIAALLVAAVSLPGLVGLGRKRAFLHGFLAAAPPMRAGEPAGCRVCGAPVEGLGVVRCGFCRSDNIVDARVMARSGETHTRDVADLVSDANAHAIDEREIRVRSLIITFGLAAFLIPFVTAVYGDKLLDRILWSVADDARYELRPRYGDACLTQKPRPDDKPAIDTVQPSWVIGKKVRFGPELTAVAHHPVYGDVAIGGGGLLRIEGMCVEDPRAATPLYVRPPRPTTGPIAAALAVRLSEDQRVKKCAEMADYDLACRFKIDGLPAEGASEAERKKFLDARTAECNKARDSITDGSLACFIALAADAGDAKSTCKDMFRCLADYMIEHPVPLGSP